MDKESMRDEYGHATEHILHYANARFKQLTLFIAISAAMISVLLSIQFNVQPTERIVLVLFGLWITIIFWVMEESSSRWWQRFVNRAAILEKELGYDCFSIKPKPQFLSITRFLRFFFLSMLGFWMYRLFCECRC